MDTEFHNEVYKILARHEFSFVQINFTLQNILTELQSLRVSRSPNITNTETNPFASGETSRQLKALVPTDLSISIPVWTYTRVALSSGLAWKHSIDVEVGIIDTDYPGPMGVIIFKERIVLLIFERIMTPVVLKVKDCEPLATLSGNYPCTYH